MPQVASKKLLQEITGIFARQLAETFVDCWQTRASLGAEWSKLRQDLTVRHLNRLGRRLQHLGEPPELKLDFTASAQRSEADLLKSALKSEAALINLLRMAIPQLHACRDWGSEDLVKMLLHEREELVQQIETDSDPILEHLWDDEGLSMSPQSIH
ncbi:MAG: hypothetical protein FH749_10220 [Firmicutes bacterium]|nr:hypothetical protein [Bacillota bacterium]